MTAKHEAHTRIGNELLEALYRFPFTAAQLRVVLWVARDSHGWRRRWTRALSMSGVSEETRVPKASVGWAVTVLVKAGVILKDEKGRYALHRRFNEWMVQAADRLPLLSNPLDGASNPLDEIAAQVVQPIGRIVQPIGRNGGGYKVLKEKKRKGVGALTRFTVPTIEEVAAYCKERGNGVNADRWHAHYTANGWKVGRNSMKDWKAAVRTWEDGPVSPTKTKAARCRCGVNGSTPTVVSRDGKTKVCANCRLREDIEAGEA